MMKPPSKYNPAAVWKMKFSSVIVMAFAAGVYASAPSPQPPCAVGCYAVTKRMFSTVETVTVCRTDAKAAAGLVSLPAANVAVMASGRSENGTNDKAADLKQLPLECIGGVKWPCRSSIIILHHRRSATLTSLGYMQPVHRRLLCERPSQARMSRN